MTILSPLAKTITIDYHLLIVMPVTLFQREWMDFSTGSPSRRNFLPNYIPHLLQETTHSGFFFFFFFFASR